MKSERDPLKDLNFRGVNDLEIEARVKALVGEYPIFAVLYRAISTFVAEDDEGWNGVGDMIRVMAEKLKNHPASSRDKDLAEKYRFLTTVAIIDNPGIPLATKKTILSSAYADNSSGTNEKVSS